MKLQILGFLLSGIPMLLSAQQPLTGELNSARPGDELIKQQVEWKNPGKQGTNQFWDFSKLNPVNDEYTVNYIERGKSGITGIEHGTYYYYSLSNDSLLLWGNENSTTLVKYTQPELVLKFPLSYGSKSEGYYYGKGKYGDRIEIDLMGKTYSHTDATGSLLLPEQDTLRQVVRVHTVKKAHELFFPIPFDFDANTPVEGITAGTIEEKLQSDTTISVVESYRWFVEGYRYPVFEIIETRIEKNGQSTLLGKTAFHYHPLEQKSLPYDSKNEALQDIKRLKQYDSADKTVSSLQPGYNIYPNPVVDLLQIAFSLKESLKVEIFLYDMQGKLLLHKANMQKSGSITETVDMKSLNPGNYLLMIKAGDKSEKKIIVKQ